MQLQNEGVSEGRKLENNSNTVSDSIKRTENESSLAAMQGNGSSAPVEGILQTETADGCKENGDSRTPQENLNFKSYADEAVKPKTKEKGASPVSTKVGEPEGGTALTKYSRYKVESNKSDKEIVTSLKTNSKITPKKKDAKKTRQGGRRQHQQKVASGAPSADVSAGLDSSDSEFSDDARSGGNKPNQKSSLMGPTREACDLHTSRDKKPEEPKGLGPFFYIGGGNGVALVHAYFVQKGWQRIYDKNREDYKLRWCETKCMSSYYSFKEGEQLIYQIPNNKVLTTKIGLLNSLREYERVMNKVKTVKTSKLLKLEDFFPETFRMDVKDERESFFMLYKEKQVWICKPTGLNQGRGIFLLKSGDEVAAFRANLQSIEDNPVYRKQPFKSPQARIVQRYIHNPLLLEGKKFDVRSYFLIACTTPYIIFFHHGYIRLTCSTYDPHSDDLTAHLTNQYMQKKNPLYNEVKEETVWSMERLNNYINEKFVAAKGIPEDWVFTVFTKRMQQIMMQCFLAVKSKLECKLGYFDLIGCDFLIDEDFKVWFLEMNCNPALHTNCDVLKEVIPSVVNETLDLTLEIFNKSRKGLKILPLQSLSSFVLLYNGDLSEQLAKSTRLKTAGAKTPQKMQRPKSASQPAQLASKVAEKSQKGTPPTENTCAGAGVVASNSLSKLSDRAILSMSHGQVPLVQNISVPYAIKHKVRNDHQFSGRSRQFIDESVLPEHKTYLGLSREQAISTLSMPVLTEKSYVSPQPQRVVGYRSPSIANVGLNAFFLSSPHISPLRLQARVTDPRVKGYSCDEVTTSDGAGSLYSEKNVYVSNSETKESVMVTRKSEKTVSFSEEQIKLSSPPALHNNPVTHRGA